MKPEDILMNELIKRGVTPYVALESARQAMSSREQGDRMLRAGRIAERLQPGFRFTK